MTYEFTVFTPTYNRGHTLHRVYESLCAQTFRDFEWLIVDDGSTDNTGALVRDWMSQASFPIRYLRQENAGKHVAFNRGALEARGRLFLNLDSDDSCVPEALERFKFHWDAIPASQRSSFCGVTALCKRPDGTPVGQGFPRDVVDCSSLDINFRHGCYWEKWGFICTDVLRQYPFPVFGKENHANMSFIYNRMGLHFKTRFVNEFLRTYYTTAGSLSGPSVRIRNPRGAAAYYREFASLPIPWRWRLRGWVNYLRYSGHVALKTVREGFKEQEG
jgi:glycosyltransferase involved in cell wall biosynthesis